MSEYSLPFDVCERKHKGNEQSVAANPSRLCKREAHEKIIGLLRMHPMTAKEIAADFGVELHKVSGRISEMKAMRLVNTTGQKRDGSAEIALAE